MISVQVTHFDEWRTTARALLTQQVAPELVHWQDALYHQGELFSNDNAFSMPDSGSQSAASFNVSRDFLTLARVVSCYRSLTRWGLLYSLLWRITHGEPHLLKVSSDPLVHQLFALFKAVKRDAHKMKAFVRFCKLEDTEDTTQYLAWYKPDHLIVRLVAPFFQRRFEVMNWTIVTPDETVHWNGETLQFSAGQVLTTNPTDELQTLWQTYYRSIFNPARIKLSAMKREMPVRFWHNLPETEVMNTLLQEAPQRVQTMIDTQEGLSSSAADFLPQDRTSLPSLAAKAEQCQGCPLYRKATQTVFGQGNPNAPLMLVGEQPGDQEDLAGKPFVGPAGRLLRTLLEQLGIDEQAIYFTNAVKHFKYTLTHQHRLHRAPSIREINACKPWLQAEVALVKPQVILCLGLSAAKALINPAFHIKKERGQLVRQHTYLIGASYHPSAILRAPNPTVKAELTACLQKDLITAYQQINRLG